LSRKPARRKNKTRPRGHARQKRADTPESTAALLASAGVQIYEPAAPSLTWRQRLRTVFLCAVLEFAALTGAPMRPEEIRSLMQTMNQPKVVHVLPEEEDSGDGDGRR